MDFYTCGALNREAILKAVEPWGVVKKAMLVLDREQEEVALEPAAGQVIEHVWQGASG